MRHLLDGARAGLFSALILTLWSFLGILGAMAGSSTGTGFSYIATAFGLLGLPQILYGLGLGLVITIWARVLTGPLAGDKGLADPDTDRKVGVAAVALPVIIGLASLGVAGAHLAVTSKFVRANFQAMGLTVITAATLVALVAAAPILLWILDRIFKLIPFPATDKVPVITTTVLALYGATGLVVLVLAYRYAAGLSIWSSQLLQMSVAAVILTPVLTALMTRFRIERIAWRYGLPFAGLIAAAVCFAGASDWAVSSQDMRRATLRDSHLLAATARMVLPLDASESGSDNIFAFNQDPCDEEDPDAECEPVAQTGPPLTSLDHPARRSMRRAVEAGNQAAVNRFEQIPAPPKNLVVILIDTLRQDHLGYAGYERDTSPNIDKIANDAVVFLDSYAPSPHTPRSIPPLFFSRYSSRMRWDGAQYNYPRVRPENLSLFEVLADRNYHNIGMTSHFYFSERQGIRQGFETWDNEGAGTIAESNDDIASPRIWEKLQPVIESLGKDRRENGDEARPFSLFIHLFEPHARWIGHKEFDFGRGETTHERHINNYDSEIAFTDSYVGRIVEKLEAEGLYDDVIFVITSDHGEAFNEHGYYFHGQTLYNEVIKVPLIIRVPGWFSRQVRGPVSLIDVAPTLLDLMDITIPGEFEGVSLSDNMLGRSEPALRPVFSELLPYTSWKEHHRALIYGDEKFIINFTLGIEELYDLAKDPGEQVNLRSSEPERAKRLKDMLQEFMAK